MTLATRFILVIILATIALPIVFSCTTGDDDDDDDDVSESCSLVCDAIVDCALADEVGVSTMPQCYEECDGRWESCVSISSCDELAECLELAGDDDTIDDDDNTADDDDDDATPDDDDDDATPDDDDDATPDDDDDDDDTTPIDDDDTTPTDDDTGDDDTGDDDDTTPTDDDTGDDDTSVPDAEWTFIVYMAGDNSLYSYALDDLNEMKAVGTSADVNILVVFDGTFNNDSRIYKVTQNNLQVLNNPGELNMGDPNTVKTYVTALINNFPAQRTALIYWNHGSGWHEDGEPAVPYKDVCQDGSDWLTNTELDGAMQYVRSNTSVGKFEIVGFDACLMQMIEIAYYLKDDANYMIGSEETEGAQGWDYSASLQYLVNNPTMTTIAFGTKIVDSYLASPDATLSVLKMDQLSNLATKVDALADLLNNVGGASNSDVLNALRDTLYFSDYDYIDLYHFASNIKSKNISTAINTAADNLMSAVNSAVAYADYGQWGYGDAHGVSIYFPDPYWSSYDSAYGNLSFAQDTNWDDVID